MSARHLHKSDIRHFNNWPGETQGLIHPRQTKNDKVFINFIPIMLIGELSKASGFSKDTIRFYEKIGLIELSRHARRYNNYKDYPDEVLRTLKSIRNLKSLGFTLEEIREIIVRKQINALDKETSFKIIEQKIIHLDIQINKLLLYKQRLQMAQMQMEGETISHIIPFTEMKLCA